MILRRVIEHARQQHWTAIAIDFVIVVVGVFIGIQVSNWNEALAEQRLGRAYAARLAHDLEQDLATRRAIGAYYGAVLASVERADALLADPHSDAKALVVAAYRASEIYFQTTSRATWDEIVSSGKAGLLARNVASTAGDYYSFDTGRKVLDVLGVSAYRHRVRAIIPLAVQKALRAGCSDLRNDARHVTGFRPGCSLDVEPALIEATAAALRADPQVQRDLRYQYSDVFAAHANVQGDVVAIEKALAALGHAQTKEDAR